MRLNNSALLIILFIVLVFLCSFFGIISVSLTEIISYSLLIIGISLVYNETIRQNRLSVFLGSIIFLLGVYIIVLENFNLNLSERLSVPTILFFAGSGLLVLHISTSTKIIFLVLAAFFLSAGVTLFIINSHFHINTFVQSILLISNILWPVLIVLAIFVFLMRDKNLK
jgi:hypothetical protein